MSVHGQFLSGFPVLTTSLQVAHKQNFLCVMNYQDLIKLRQEVSDLSLLFPPSLVGAYYLYAPDAPAIFLHKALLFNGLCSVTGRERITYWGDKRKRSKISWHILIRSYQDLIKVCQEKFLYQDLGKMFQVSLELSRSCMMWQSLSNFVSLGSHHSLNIAHALDYYHAQTGFILLPPVFFKPPATNYMLIYSTFSCEKIARVPGGHKRFLLAKLGEGAKQNRSHTLMARRRLKLVLFIKSRFTLDAL